MHLLRFVLKLVGAMVGLSLAVAAIGFLVIDLKPVINRALEITPASIERAKQILNENDPRQLHSGERKTITLSERDLDLVANYVAQRYANGSARVILQGEAAQLTVSMPVQKGRWTVYLNVDATLMASMPLPQFQRLRVGSLPIPARIGDSLLEDAAIHFLGKDNFAALGETVEKVQLAHGRVSVEYVWHAHLKDKIRSALLSPDDRERLKVYQERLYQTTSVLSTGNVPLPQLLAPIFNLADQRSQYGDPVAENRAAILIAALYVNELKLDKLIPEAKDWPRPVMRTVTLYGRDDFPKHFIVSAILGAKGGGVLSDAVGVYKELADARTGSGFSFNDLAADRAGTRFGEAAVASTKSARALQTKVAAGLKDNDVLPAITDLPEFVSDAEFKRRFGGIDAPLYQKMISEIEHRVSTLALYR